MVPLGIWTVIELHIAIIVASLPPCRALVLRTYARMSGASFQVSNYGSRTLHTAPETGSIAAQQGSGLYDGQQQGWVTTGNLGDTESEIGPISQVALNRNQS